MSEIRNRHPDKPTTSPALNARDHAIAILETVEGDWQAARLGVAMMVDAGLVTTEYAERLLGMITPKGEC
jgi:hypothetical protein